MSFESSVGRPFNWRKILDVISASEDDFDKCVAVSAAFATVGDMLDAMMMGSAAVWPKNDRRVNLQLPSSFSKTVELRAATKELGPGTFNLAKGENDAVQTIWMANISAIVKTE